MKTIKIPIELPGLDERLKKVQYYPSVKEELFQLFIWEWNEKKGQKFAFDKNEKEKEKKIVVNLSWDKSIKTVTNWMRKHMEAYPETMNWFLVCFWSSKPCYKVEESDQWWKDCVKINGINYNIISYGSYEDYIVKIKKELWDVLQKCNKNIK